MSTKGSTAGLLALLTAGLFAVAPPVASADRLLSPSPILDNWSSPQGYGGNITWFDYGSDPAAPPRTLLDRDGQVRELRLSGDTHGVWGTTPFDLGPDASGRPVAVFPSCEEARERCAIRVHDLATDQEKTIKTVRAPCGSISQVSIWRDTIAFVRTEPRRIRDGEVICTWDQVSGSPNTSLVMVKARPRAKPKVVKRYRGRGRRYYARSVPGVELSGRYLVWLSQVSDDYSGSYVARVRDRRTLRTCNIGGGTWYKDVHDYGVARPTQVGEHIVWAETFEETIQKLLRQRGCNPTSRQTADKVGQLLDASTFVYAPVPTPGGHRSLFLSEALPAFGPNL
jgi:hypothetical protein